MWPVATLNAEYKKPFSVFPRPFERRIRFLLWKRSAMEASTRSQSAGELPHYLAGVASQELMDASFASNAAEFERNLAQAAPVAVIADVASDGFLRVRERALPVEFEADFAPDGVLARVCDDALALDASLSLIASEFEQNLHTDGPEGVASSNWQRSTEFNAQENPRDGNWLTVNVGGMRFEASRQTLCMDANSMLAAWVLRHHKDKEVLRIDRDGERFASVLNYLRNGTIWLDDVPSLRGVHEEACFYQLEGLQALCEEKIYAIQAKQEADSRRRIEEMKEALKAAFSWHSDKVSSPKERGEVLAILRGRRLGISEQPLFQTDADF